MAKREVRTFAAPDGVRYRVQVSNPGSSNAIVVFRHPDPKFAGRDRYAWFINRGAEARSVTSRLDPERVLEGLTDADVAKLYRRSMPVSSGWN